MAFVYSAVDQAKKGMDVATNNLAATLRNFSNLVHSNVNNPAVWKGTSAEAFLAKWDEFEENFRSYVNAFNHQKEIAQAAINRFSTAEKN